MVGRDEDIPLREALGSSRRLGMLGAAPIADVIDHSETFVAALHDVTGTVVDLGSGGGVPGLVIAWRRPDLRIVLVDRRQSRTDHLRRLVGRLGIGGRVSVVNGDAHAVADLIDEPVAAVVARGFGKPVAVIAAVRPLLRAGGLLVVSEPPSGVDRWRDILGDDFLREPSDRRLAVMRRVPRGTSDGGTSGINPHRDVSIYTPVVTDAAMPPPLSPSTAFDPNPEAISQPAEAPTAAVVEPVESPPSRHPGRYPLPRVIAIANQKGGVGKTTTTINVGASLAELGQRVLIVDLDPQANASTGLGIENRGLETSMYHVLMQEIPLENCIEPTDVKGLFVAPASLDLAGAEIELVPAFSRETRLRRAVDAVREQFDYVLIDCPPSLGLLTVNGLSAAQEVMVPIQCEYYALEGLGQLLRNVDLVRRNLNPDLHVSTIVCVMYDARTKLADQVVSEVRDHFGDKVVGTVVPRSVRLSEAPSYGQPITTFDTRSRGALAYRDVAKEIHDESTQRTG